MASTKLIPVKPVVIVSVTFLLWSPFLCGGTLSKSSPKKAKQKLCTSAPILTFPKLPPVFPFTSNSFHFPLSLNASGFAASKKNTICTIFWEKNVFKSEWTFLELFQRSEKKTFFRKQLAFVIEIQLDFDTSLFVGSYWLAQKKKLMAI